MRIDFDDWYVSKLVGHGQERAQTKHHANDPVASAKPLRPDVMATELLRSHGIEGASHLIYRNGAGIVDSNVRLDTYWLEVVKSLRSIIKKEKRRERRLYTNYV